MIVVTLNSYVHTHLGQAEATGGGVRMHVLDVYGRCRRTWWGKAIASQCLLGGTPMPDLEDIYTY